MAQSRSVAAGDCPLTQGPSQPPKQIFDPNRTYAKDQPPNVREVFTNFYPNGLPNMYKMLQTPGPEGVIQTYVEDYLPVGFYKNPRTEDGAIFSTINGTKQFRHLHEQLLPQRRVHLWCKDEVQSVCNSLRKLYWHLITRMPKPDCWESLWAYFDAQDVYDYGALNLWNVINHLFDENVIIGDDVKNIYAIEIGLWVDNWLYNQENCDKIIGWDGAFPIANLLTDEDWKGLGSISNEALSLVISALEHRRSLLLSPEKLRPGALKPNHLMDFREMDSLENWLAGQRQLGRSGLPTVPRLWEPHHGSPASKNAPHPAIALDGKHYYDPSGQRVPSAVEALHQSAAAAGPATHCNREIISDKQKRYYNTAASGSLLILPQARSKSAELFPSFRMPSPHTTCNQNPEEGSSHMQTNNTNGRHGQDEEAPSRSEEHPTENSKVRSAELRLSPNEKPKKSQRPNRTLARTFAQSVAHDQRDMKYPGKVHTFSRTQRPNLGLENSVTTGGLPGDIMVSEQNVVHTPLGTTFHPAAQGKFPISQQNFPNQNGFDYGPQHVPQPSLPQRGPVPNRGRNASNSSRKDRFDSNDVRWSHQNYEISNGGSTGFSRGGFQRGGGRKGNRGGHNRRNATAPVSQSHAGFDFGQKKRDGIPWKEPWRKGPSECKNVQNGLTIKEYVPCSCSMCEARNRSVYIIVGGHEGIDITDMLARLKYGLSERYGYVEEVYPIASKEPGRYIARFAEPSSVSEALTIGGGNMPERGISVTFSPALRSRWTLAEQAPTRPGPGRVIGQTSHAAPFSPYAFGLPMPNIAPSATVVPQMMPGINHQAVVNHERAHNTHIWPVSGHQHSISRLAQPPASGVPSAIVQSAYNSQAFFPEQPILAPTQVPAPPTAHLQKENMPSYEILQTKPPAEEALDEVNHVDPKNAASPRSDGSKYTGVKARVSLPSTPSARTSLTPQKTPTEPKVTEEGTVCAEPATHHHTEKPMKWLDSQGEAKVTSCGQAKPGSQSNESKNRHSRASSIFSENEIKERRQAWAKIPMPLYPHRSRSATPIKSNSVAIDNDRVPTVQSDNREANTPRSEKPTLAHSDSDGAHGPSTTENPKYKFPLRHAPREYAIDSQKATREEPQQSDVPIDSNAARKFEQSNYTHMGQSQEQNFSTYRSSPNHEQEYDSGTLPRGKGKNAKKTKKKKSKQSLESQTNMSVVHTVQQNQSSSAPQSSHIEPQTMCVGSGGHGFGTNPGAYVESQDSGSSSPIKRHHDEAEQPAVSGSTKRSKKYGNNHEISQYQSQPQNLFEESDSPGKDERGRRGFRMGRGGSLRLGKQRRPRPMIPGPMLAEQQSNGQTPPYSSGFSFQCQSLPVPDCSQNLPGHENGATSRLNPKAQEFVSPSRTASKEPIARFDGIEPSGGDTVNELHGSGQLEQTDESTRESFKAEHNACEAPLQDENAARDSQAPKHRRAISEVAQKGTPRKGKGHSHQGEGKKTPAKNSKRGKGKERAVTLSAKPDKIELKGDKAQVMPQTPENRGGKVKNPGLINEDWPSLPASRERAQSKPQTPSVWSGKTKTTKSGGIIEQGSPLPKE
ncbi:hypothetical protein FBEOM_2204 [Fusarium beomiforme]|uniref:RRM domain-containing protein n=1 Tax=Fusarium beomiforme TaxID=44412 RepID=A0A9P5E3R4_9HYPO|nr:hypothetical protein FBEOM_2204 [Fusarium beomiforme]